MATNQPTGQNLPRQRSQNIRNRQTAGGRGIGQRTTATTGGSLTARAGYSDGFADGVEHMRRLFRQSGGASLLHKR
jgi:hypothetical protein